ncbi:MAG: hypothetical protein E6J40_06460 [Chloroflexi bacterium]|nr:MAG: hypothetical protein E6J40_06460 [Chloroflexota bacterium]
MLAILATISCLNGSSGTPASGARTASPASVGATADSKAADLRARLDTLLGEHVMVIAKESLAAAANRADEYKGYATLLTINASDLGDVMSAAFGTSAATRFAQIWAEQNNYFVDYTVGVVSHNAAKSNGAASGLVDGFVPKFAQYMSSMTSIPLDPITQLATEQVLETKAIIDDQAALNNAKMFADLRRAYAQALRIGDVLAPAITRKFADKFPGDPANKAVDFRVSLETLLEEHSYLATMTSGATTAGRNTEEAAALTALAANADALGTLFSGVFGTAIGTRFDQVWNARDAELVVYASNATEANRQAASDSLSRDFVSQFTSLVRDSVDVTEGAIGYPVQSQLADLIKVIDDQRSKAAAQLGADDHTAASATYPIADVIASAAVAKLPASFGS